MNTSDISPKIPHRWDLTPTEAIRLQQELAVMVDATTPLDFDRVNLVAGVDVSVKEGVSRAAIVVMRFPEMILLEIARAEMPTPFPYVPGLLSFREGAVILQAQKRLNRLPDVYIFDGQGIAHPRRLGIASHIGLWLNMPCIGCAKSRLVGAHAELPLEAGSSQPLLDGDEIIGMVLRTRKNTKPVYISVGHQVTLESAVEMVRRCVTRYRLPEPIREAHHAAGLGSGSNSKTLSMR